MDETTSAYREADIVVFNTGHWWTHEKTSRGCVSVFFTLACGARAQNLVSPLTVTVNYPGYWFLFFFFATIYFYRVNYYQEGDHVYPLLKVMKAYEKALTTWARWVDRNINSSKTQVVFRGYSLTHFRYALYHAWFKIFSHSMYINH